MSKAIVILSGSFVDKLQNILDFNFLIQEVSLDKTPKQKEYFNENLNSQIIPLCLIYKALIDNSITLVYKALIGFLHLIIQ
jgi:hypothetical protein